MVRITVHTAQHKKVCIVTRNTVTKDHRTIKEAEILARFGFDVVVVGLWAKGLPVEEGRSAPINFKIKRIPPASYSISTSLIRGYRRLSQAGPKKVRSLMRKADPLVASVIRRVARFLNRSVTLLALTKAGLQERADFYHAHFPLSLMVLVWLGCVCLRHRFVRDYNDIIVLNRAQKSEAYYEQNALWGGELRESELMRIKDIIAMIPTEVSTILDVGCGDGRITNRLVDSYQVVGLDISRTALQHVRARTVLGTVENLPFADRSFDLVLAAELLEHLPPSSYRRALQEIQRVAKQWILVSVPWREQLALGRTRCARCGTVFHVNRHFRSFGLRDLKRLFAPAFQLTAMRYTGGQRRSFVKGLLWVKQHIGGIWVRTATTVCPNCSAHLYPGGYPERNAISMLCDKWSDRISDRRRAERSHVIALYRGEGVK